MWAQIILLDSAPFAAIVTEHRLNDHPVSDLYITHLATHLNHLAGQLVPIILCASSGSSFFQCLKSVPQIPDTFTLASTQSGPCSSGVPAWPISNSPF